MIIDEKIQEMQSKLIKVVTDANTLSKEDAVRKIEQFGLDNDSAIKLLESFRNAENARKAAKNVWDSALESRVGNDNDIAEYQQQESETRQHFDAVNAKCALIMVARTIEPRAINDEVLGKLYEQEIEENQIANPALRISFHYYSESKAKDTEVQKLKDWLVRAGKQITALKNRILEGERQYKVLKRSYENLQEQSIHRSAIAEKHYQSALVQISILKNKLSRLQNRGIFQTIKAKIFRSKVKELPEGMPNLPSTLYNPAEKMGIKLDKGIDITIGHEIKKPNLPTKEEEYQQ